MSDVGSPIIHAREPVDHDSSASRCTSETIAFRVCAAQAQSIRLAAQDAGVSVSEWIREAAGAALEPDACHRGGCDIEKELTNAEKQLDAANQRLHAAREQNGLTIPAPGKTAARSESDRQTSVTLAARLSATEASLIRQAAYAADVTLSQWMRQAAAAAMHHRDCRRSGRNIERELVRARKSLDAAIARMQGARELNALRIGQSQVSRHH